VLGAEEGVAWPDGHADELVVAALGIGPEGRAELTSLAHSRDLGSPPPLGQVFRVAGGAPHPEKAPAWPDPGPRVRHRPAMYLATRNKPRKTNRKRSVRYKAKLSAKNRGRRQGLKK